MSLVGDPVPPKPSSFTAHGVPPGWDAINDAFGSWSTSRPFIVPRVLVIHTNAASGESSIDAAIRWGNSSSSNTKPHGQAAKPRPAQLLPTNRRAIVNATWDSIQNRLGVDDSSFWSCGLETADMGSIRARNAGYSWPTDCGPFLYDHEELIARWCAYKCIAHQIPPVWLPFSEHNFTHGRGIITHTDPFPPGYFTIVDGKTCPGSTKKERTRTVIVPRAAEIYKVWTGQILPPVVKPPKEDEVPEVVKIKNIDGSYITTGAGLFWLKDAEARDAALKRCKQDKVREVLHAEFRSYGCIVGERPEGYSPWGWPNDWPTPEDRIKAIQQQVADLGPKVDENWRQIVTCRGEIEDQDRGLQAISDKVDAVDGKVTQVSAKVDALSKKVDELEPGAGGPSALSVENVEVAMSGDATVTLVPKEQ